MGCGHALCSRHVALCAQARLKEVTINDEIEADPELAKKIDDEISKGSYY